MDKILEALKKLLPANSLNEVSEAIGEMLAEAKSELDAEYDAKLNEAYVELSAQLTEAERVGIEGYQQAYECINDLRNRLEIANEEFDKHLETEFAKAAAKIEEAKAETEALSAKIYEEYDEKLDQMKEYIVDKVDAFLQFKGKEIYEQAKRDVLSDPRMAERQVALDKIVEVASTYLSNEDYALATSTKLDQAQKEKADLQAQIKMMESRNIRLSQDITKLNEAVRHNQELVVESKRIEKKERVQNAKNVSGRGKVETVNVEVIAEHKQSPTKDNTPTEDTTKLFENLGVDRETMNLLAGTKKNS